LATKIEYEDDPVLLLFYILNADSA